LLALSHNLRLQSYNTLTLRKLNFIEQIPKNSIYGPQKTCCFSTHASKSPLTFKIKIVFVLRMLPETIITVGEKTQFRYFQSCGIGRI
jgi:hypothetical protein